MKNVNFLILAVLLVGCGDSGNYGFLTTGPQGAQGYGAGVYTQSEAGVCNGNGGVAVTSYQDKQNLGYYVAGDEITSTSLICNGNVGAQGISGAAGQNGTSSVVASTAATLAQCPTGGWNFTVTNGGVASAPYTVCNGLVGAQGAAGQNAPASPLAIEQLLTPCGLASSAWKEELILLGNGSLLADFSENLAGQDTRLALIPDNNYQDSDESACFFSVSTNMQTLTRTLSWSAGHSSAEPNGWAAGSTSWSVPAGFNPSVGE